MKNWSNRVTREVYVRVLEDWNDPMAEALAWLDVGQGSAVAGLARRLKKDFYAEYGDLPCDFLAASFFRVGLREVDWRQVAERLLARALRPEEEAPQREEGGEASA